MNYLTESNNEALNHLLAEKAFDELTQEEQAGILAEMSEVEYRQLCKLARDANAVLSPHDELIPRKDIRVNVRNYMRNQAQQTPAARRKVFRSTLFQIAAAIALLVIGIQLTTRSSKGLIPNNQKNSEFIDSTSTDSAMQHKTGPNEDTVLLLDERLETATLREERRGLEQRVDIAALRDERHFWDKGRETALLREERNG